jgi:hypothetical protein
VASDVVSTPAFERPGLARGATAVGVIAAAGLALGFWLNPVAAARSYLWAYCWVLGIALGSLVLLMLQHVTGGAWGVVIRRPAEAAVRTLPLIAVLFVPLALFAGQLYPWAHPEHGPLPGGKGRYLDLSWWWARAAVYFVVWVGLGFILDRWSKHEDEGRPAGWERRMRLLSAPGMGLYGLALTFASIDWVMSLEPHWFSSIFGVLFGAGQLLSGLSFCIIVVLMLADRPPYRGALVPGHLRDLGSLLLAFVMLWAYLSVSQLILIWSANLKEEAPYYVVRASGGWQYVVTLVVLLQFVAPFLILLTRDGKRNPQRLLIVAGMILVTRLVDLFWVIAPARDLDGHGRHVAWTDPIAVLALGGLWLALYLWELGRRPLLPVHADTSVQEDHHA